MDESTSLRNKEKEDYDAVAAESATNIKALSGALPALKKGLGGAALVQMAGASRSPSSMGRSGCPAGLWT